MRLRVRSVAFFSTTFPLPPAGVPELLVEVQLAFSAKDRPQRLQVTASACDNL